MYVLLPNWQSVNEEKIWKIYVKVILIIALQLKFEPILILNKAALVHLRILHF